MSKDSFGYTIMILATIGFFALVGKNVYDQFKHESRLINQRTISGRIIGESYRPGFFGFYSSYNQGIVSNGQQYSVTFYQTITGCEQIESLDSLFSKGDSISAIVAEDFSKDSSDLVGISERKILKTKK